MPAEMFVARVMVAAALLFASIGAVCEWRSPPFMGDRIVNALAGLAIGLLSFLGVCVVLAALAFVVFGSTTL